LAEKHLPRKPTASPARKLGEKRTLINLRQTAGNDPKSSLRYPQGIKERSDEAIFQCLRDIWRLLRCARNDHLWPTPAAWKLPFNVGFQEHRLSNSTYQRLIISPQVRQYKNNEVGATLVLHIQKSWTITRAATVTR
jgi:hypothetical protein